MRCVPCSLPSLTVWSSSTARPPRASAPASETYRRTHGPHSWRSRTRGQRSSRHVVSSSARSSSEIFRCRRTPVVPCLSKPLPDGVRVGRLIAQARCGPLSYQPSGLDAHEAADVPVRTGGADACIDPRVPAPDPLPRFPVTRFPWAPVIPVTMVRLLGHTPDLQGVPTCLDAAVSAGHCTPPQETRQTVSGIHDLEDNPVSSLSVDLSPVSAGLWKLPMSHGPRVGRVMTALGIPPSEWYRTLLTRG